MRLLESGLIESRKLRHDYFISGTVCRQCMLGGASVLFMMHPGIRFMAVGPFPVMSVLCKDGNNGAVIGHIDTYYGVLALVI